MLTPDTSSVLGPATYILLPARRATFSTPRAFASRSFAAEKNPRSAVASHGGCSNKASCCSRAGIQAWVSAALPSCIGKPLTTPCSTSSHQPPQLGGLVGFPFADDLGVLFEQTQHFLRRVRVSLPQPLPRLGDHLLHPGEEVAQRAGLNFRSHHLAHHLHPPRLPILERRAGLPHHAPSHPQPLAITVPQPLRVGRGEGLGGAADLQQAMLHRSPSIHPLQG